MDDDRPHKATDIHRYTLEHDVYFHFYMNVLFGEEWKTWAFDVQRRHAKAWNFGKLYGARGSDWIKKLMEE